jgi:Arc/MetJ-type ribon-helix-helix transcriptional regulator
MNHSLPVDIQQRIDAQLASGTFTNEEDVLREALDALERRQRGLTQLREMVAVADEDVAAGRVGTFNRDDIKSDVRARLAERGIRE